MTWDPIIKVLATMFALSGWFKVYYDHLSNKPKITGRLLVSLIGIGEFEGKKYSTFIVYPYLVNARKNVVHVLDYELHAKIPSGWRKLISAYGAHRLKDISFGTASDEIKIPKFNEDLIYRRKEAVQQGIPLHGWLLFLGDVSLHSTKISSYRLVCIDANLKRHVIVTKVKHLTNLNLVAQVADIEFPRSMVRQEK